jgi:hypothetical protein
MNDNLKPHVIAIVFSMVMDLIYMFDPDKKVWINLLDGGRFVGSF